MRHVRGVDPDKGIGSVFICVAINKFNVYHLHIMVTHLTVGLSHPANSRRPTFEEVRDLPVGDTIYYRGCEIERVADHACKVDGYIKNYPQDVIDEAVHRANLGSMSNCYKKYIAALEYLLLSQ